MQAFFGHGDREWKVGWGINLVGTAKGCEIQVPSSGGEPEVAGAILRWNDYCEILGFGPDRALRPAPGMRQTFDFPLTTENRERRIDHSALRRELRLWESPAYLRWDPPPSPVLREGLSASAVRDVFRAATALGDRLDRSCEAELIELLGRVVHGHEFRAVPPGDPDAIPITCIPMRSVSVSISLDSTAAGRRQDPVMVRKAVLDLAGCIAQILDGLLTGSGDSATPAFAPCVANMPDIKLIVGSRGYVSGDDLKHLDAGFKDEPQHPLLLSTIGGQLQVVSCTRKPGLKSDGSLHWRIRPAFGEEFTVVGPNAKFRMRVDRIENTMTPHRLVSRTFSTWTTPILQVVRLGLIQPSLEKPRERLQSLQGFLLNATQSHGCWIGRVDGGNRWGTGLQTYPASDFTVQTGPVPRLLTVLAGRLEAGKWLETTDVYRDERLMTGTVLDELGSEICAVGPMLMYRDEKHIVCLWRQRESSRYLDEDQLMTEAAAMILAEGEWIPAKEGVAVAPRRGPPETGVVGSLHRDRWKLPIRELTTLGRDAGMDVRTMLEDHISAFHAVLFQDGPNLRVLNARSRNGVRVNGSYVNEAALKDGDTLQLAGGPSFRFRVECKNASHEGLDAYLGEDDPTTAEDSVIRRFRESILRGPEPESALAPDAPILHAGASSRFVDRALWVGRSPECEVVIDEEPVSRKHLLLIPSTAWPDRVWFVDNHSTIGTQLNGKSTQHGFVGESDRLTVGSTMLRVSPRAGVRTSPSADEERLARHLREMAGIGAALGPAGERTASLDLSRALASVLAVSSAVIVLTGSEPNLLWSSVPEKGHWSPQSLLNHEQIRRLMTRSLTTRSALVGSLRRPEVYTRLQVSIMMDLSDIEPSAIAIPLRPHSAGEHLLVATSRKEAAVAFRRWQLPALAALGGLIVDRNA